MNHNRQHEMAIVRICWYYAPDVVSSELVCAKTRYVETNSIDPWTGGYR